MKSLQQWLNTDDVFAAQAGARITKIEEGMAQANMTVHSSHLNAGGCVREVLSSHWPTWHWQR